MGGEEDLAEVSVEYDHVLGVDVNDVRAEADQEDDLSGRHGSVEDGETGDSGNMSRSCSY